MQSFVSSQKGYEHSMIIIATPEPNRHSSIDSVGKSY